MSPVPLKTGYGPDQVTVEPFETPPLVPLPPQPPQLAKVLEAGGVYQLLKQRLSGEQK